MDQKAEFGDIPAPTPADPESAFGTKIKGEHPPRSSLRELDPPGADKLGLSADEITQFREQGYIIKRGLIPPKVFEPFHKMWWHQPPVVNAGVNQNNPSTWIAPGRHWPEENRWSTAKNWMGGNAWPVPGDERPGADDLSLIHISEPTRPY